MMQMKYILPLFLIFVFLSLSSCKKESATIDDVIATLKLDENTHTYINDEGGWYYENSHRFLRDRHVYKVNLEKGTTYRIWTIQPDAATNQTHVMLINVNSDTLVYSEYGRIKNEVLITSPETKSYYVVITRFEYGNPIFLYHLFFEQIT